MQKLIEIMERLRDPATGCPWDREQTFATISRYTIEEAYEVADAIQRGDMDDLKDELGDLLFQVVFYAQMAREQSFFEFNDVVDAISRKMLRRHPHVFADETIGCAEEQTRAWEKHKQDERKNSQESDKQASQLDGVAQALPALMRAGKLQKRAAEDGFDWPDIHGPLAKIEEELAEVRAELVGEVVQTRLQAEIGDLLFACVNLARHAGVDPEAALRQCNDTFEQRYRCMEEILLDDSRRMQDLDLDAMEELWQEAKKVTK